MSVILEKFLHGLDGSLYLAHVTGEVAGKSTCERTSKSACEGSGAALLVKHIAGGVLLHHRSPLYEEVQQFGQLLLLPFPTMAASMGLFSLVSSLVSVGGECILLQPSLTNNGQADER